MDLLDIAIAKQLAGGGGGSGTDNYNDLSNLPKINDVTLSGNKSSSALGLQSEITSENKLDSDLIDDTDQDNKFVTSSEKNTWNAKQNAIDADHKLNADYVDDSTSTNKFVTASDKETWNAKQSAIDSDHKLSSSLVSFSAAEAAALASGIDSNKVEQIGTNQTNILYSLQTGVKNLFNPEASGNWQYGLSSYSADAKTGTISMATTASDWARTSVPITLPAGEYKFCGNVTALVGSAVITGNTSSSGQETAIFNNIELSTTGTFEISFTLNTETPFWIAVYANFSSSIVSNSVTITGMMICTKAAWDQEPNVYRPFARPNYDLTVLEAEDRNALVEVIGKGAKNQLTIPDIKTLKALNIEAGVTSGTWNGNSFTYNGVTFTINYIDNTITTSGTSTIDHERIVINKFTFKSNNDYMISGCPSGGSYSGYSIAMLNYNNRDTGGGLEVEGDDVTRYLVVYAQNRGTDMSGLTFKPMICTPDEWKISRNHESYALPNTTLTPALVEQVDEGAKNKLDLSNATITVGSGLTLTRDGDAYVVNGTLSAQSQIVFTNFPPVAGDNLILSGCPSNGSTAGYGIWAYSGSTRVIIDDGSDIKTPYSGEITQIKFNFAAGNYSNVKFYPMICTLADWKISQNYTPFALPNTDLTRMVGTLFPTTYTAPVVNSDISSKLSILSGGYAKAGNLVTVNIRLSVTDTISAGSALFTGLPEPKTTAALSYGTAVVPVTNMCVNAQVSPNVMSIDTQGTIRLAGTPVSSDITTGIYILSATYLSA